MATETVNLRPAVEAARRAMNDGLCGLTAVKLEDFVDAAALDA